MSKTLAPPPKQAKKTGRIRINRKWMGRGDGYTDVSVPIVNGDYILIDFQYEPNTHPNVKLMELLD